MFQYHRHIVYAPSAEERLKKYARILEERFHLEPELYLDRSEGPDSIIVSFPDTHPDFEAIKSFLPPPLTDEDRKKICPAEYANLPDLSLINYAPNFTDEEVASAKWFVMTSFFWAINALNEPFCDACVKEPTDQRQSPGVHQIQTEAFVVGKAVNWKQKYFCCTDMDPRVLFCSERARQLLERAGLVGIKYDPVIHKKAKQPIEDLYQLGSFYTTPDDYLVPKTNMRYMICPKCGMKVLARGEPPWLQSIRPDALDTSVDFYKTPPNLGGDIEGIREYRSYPRFIVSQRMRQFLIEQKMDRSLWFEPLLEELTLPSYLTRHPVDEFGVYWTKEDFEHIDLDSFS